MNNSVIIGTLLGDAWIQKQNRIKKNGEIGKPQYYFGFQQCNKDYTIWKSKMINLDYTIYENNRYDKRTKKTYYTCQSSIKMLKTHKEYYYNLFYRPKKEISQTIIDSIDDLALCIWFLDDGNTYYNGNNCHITIAVNGFSDESKNLIIRWFKDKYNLNFKHSCKAIRITSRRECEIFMQIIEKYIPDCMSYKKLNETISRYDKTLTNEQKKCRNKKYL